MSHACQQLNARTPKPERQDIVGTLVVMSIAIQEPDLETAILVRLG